ncbi:MAG TPA: BamA/TamA family outer membrane protein [Hymenobacter sp.]|uniref:BamA/TamA family outer membrane protein n=1 Tax=Hymenobacter sp. TaxID=1898978 RepID=UPI002D7F64DA|nr:BamA/TamA family outer membrane protein [Hymenobacter sp.]HET9505288.1 BamA/TamA family outer membrane protein [Hymenobacter sp.]
MEKVRKLTLAPGLSLLAALLWLAVGCSPLRLLRPEQRLLTKVEVESDGLSPAQQERMLTLVQQKPNRNLPIPRLAVYQFGHSFYDSARIRRKIERIQTKYAAKIAATAPSDSAKLGKLAAQRERRLARKATALEKGNAIMRLGEPPVIYDPDLSRRTVDQLTTYLRSQGFFRAQVAYTDSARSKRSLIDGVLRTLQLRNKPVHAVPLRDSAGQRLHRRVTVTYLVQEGPDFTLSKLTRRIADSAVARVVAQAQGATLLRVGEPYNEDVIGQERQRLEVLLKNAGYYDFRAQFITFEADTSFEKKQVRLGLLIANPEKGPHRRYRLRRVTMLADAGQGQVLRSLSGDTARTARQLRRAERQAARAPEAADAEGTSSRISTANMPAGVTPAAVADSLAARRRNRPRLPPRDTVYVDSVAFASRGPLAYNARILARQISLRPGQRYGLERTQRTTRLLGALDMFRFNNVTFSKVEPARPPRPDSALVAPLADYYLDALITASPSPRFGETTEIGGTYVAEKAGPFGNLRLKWRNPFHGAEILELSGRVGFEGQYNRLGAADGSSNSTLNSVYTVQYGLTAALLIPKFVVPFGVGNFLRSYQPRTRISLSQTYTSTPFYTRSNAEFTFDYLWQTSPYHQFVFTPIDAALVKTPFIRQDYRDSLQAYRRRGSPLYQSFRSIYEPSFSFTSVYNSNDLNQTRNARYLRLFVEVGGLTRNLYRTKTWFRGDREPQNQLETYDFAKLAVDYRRYYRLSPQTYLAWRLNGGVAHALTPTPTIDNPGVSAYTIPYDKYFFVGGSNSVRAWQPRRLGTGSYATQFANGQRDYITEQPGELLLEGSVEYRFPVYSFIKGALFTDFGNVWTLQPDPARPGAEFRFNTFARQFAVGSGLGIRFDFTFLILRFDIATKVYDPTNPDPWTVKNALRHTRNQTALNVGIGYPF